MEDKIMFGKNEPLKLTVESDGIKMSAELPWDATLDQILDIFTAQMIGLTWQPDTIANAFAEKAESMREDFLSLDPGIAPEGTDETEN